MHDFHFAFTHAERNHAGLIKGSSPLQEVGFGRTPRCLRQTDDEALWL